MKNYKTPIILFAVFEIIAISLWLAATSLCCASIATRANASSVANA